MAGQQETYDSNTVDDFERILVSKKVSLKARLQKNGGPISVEEIKGAERSDKPQIAMSHEAMNILDVKTLQDIEEALRKCKEGTYGICNDCGEQILLKRLEAFPTASRCLPCQEKHSRLRAPRQLSAQYKANA